MFGAHDRVYHHPRETRLSQACRLADRRASHAIVLSLRVDYPRPKRLWCECRDLPTPFSPEVPPS